MASLGAGGGGGGGGCGGLAVYLEKWKKCELMFLSAVVSTTFALPHIFFVLSRTSMVDHPCFVTKRVPMDMVCIS